MDLADAPLTMNDWVFTVDARHLLEPLCRLPSARVAVAAGERAGELVLTNDSPVLAAGVFLYGKDPA